MSEASAVNKPSSRPLFPRLRIATKALPIICMLVGIVVMWTTTHKAIALLFMVPLLLINLVELFN